MKKFFPFYKNKNLANNPLGYTTAANARKRMDDHKVEDDFSKTLPEDYWLDYSYVYKLENPWSEKLINPLRKVIDDYHTHVHGYWYYIDTYTIGDINIESQTYLKELPDNIYNIFIKLYKLEPLVIEDSMGGKTTYKEEYKNILYEILRNGYSPTIYKDKDDYKKRYRKFVTDNVEFRELEVNVNIS